MKLIVQYSLFIVSIAVFLSAGCGRQPQSGQTQAVVNQHSQPGEYYTCPMHPWIRSDKPGACPICHMTLVKVSPNHIDNDSGQAGRSVTLSTADQIRANVSTAMVESKALIKEIPAVGKIDLAESSTEQITMRFAGRIERLFISFVGQKVHVGEPLAEIYSPDAIAAQREFLVALSSPSTSPDDSTMLNLARRKLQLWGFTDQQLDRLTKDQTPSTTVMIHSHIAGTVLKKNVALQQYVSAGESLFDISDLRNVWLLLDIYETDIASVHLGQVVEATIDASPPYTLRGIVSFISPTVDPATRTVRVRAVLDNATGNLRPEMYAHATIFVTLNKSLVVPATAVVSSGKKDVVWIEREPGRFEPRQVVLGERNGDFYQILDGLHEGETVAARGAYLIDSESQLRMTTAGGAGK
jgi:Cu(I)/Ag(I) efflux system membrane fusion protein